MSSKLRYKNALYGFINSTYNTTYNMNMTSEELTLSLGDPSTSIDLHYIMYILTIIVGIIGLIIITHACYSTILDFKEGKYSTNKYVSLLRNVFKKYKTDVLLPMHKAKASPFIGPYPATENPPKLEDSNITFRFHRHKLSFNEPETYITITINESK